ncbi:NUDIX domain-containing protein [Gleimia hominis]|uniref:NUDIX domain-containing protein n=1 Tax=Gleimia hominis TaxID=595468 RepID=A0ABU3IBF0_9ACTO|nr:NUDIX domain-containing protein [Gleimia hominis]MDT3767704.1 NUDIX domain-containing protein [Gleimia hominis]
MLQAENEWPIAPDGLPTRDAARVIVISADHHVLLVKGHDFSEPNRQWWFTIGGGREKSEDAREGARRELWEETGYDASTSDFIGPVIYRDSIFRFADRDRRQREHFFLLYTSRFEPANAAWTADEQRVLDEMRWLPISQLAQLKTPIYPAQLPSLLNRWMADGWDGKCVTIAV